MAFTVLDPKTALIVIDLQKGIVAFDTVPPSSEVVARAGTMLDAFRRLNLPVVLVNVAGGASGRTEQKFQLDNLPDDWFELVPDLNAQPSDHRVTKKTWGAFTHTNLETYLNDLNVTQVVLVGISTSIGIESTARYAYEMGFNVSFVIDAMGDSDAAAHHSSITRIFPRLGETGTTDEMLELLQQTRSIVPNQGNL
jgi:nicotinamidase-related amidase